MTYLTTYLLALDQSTSSTRSIVFDASRDTVSMAQQELPPTCPRPGGVEHDPRKIWNAQLATVRDALRNSAQERMQAWKHPTRKTTCP